MIPVVFPLARAHYIFHRQEGHDFVTPWLGSTSTAVTDIGTMPTLRPRVADPLARECEWAALSCLTRKVLLERWATLMRGFRPSSIARPTKLVATTIRATSAPGGTIAHQAPKLIADRRNPNSIMVPSDTWVASPSPKNANAVSVKIAYPTRRTAFATTSGTSWGKTWCATTPGGGAPKEGPRRRTPA